MNKESLCDRHIGALIPAQPGLTLITMRDGGDDPQVEEQPVIAWILNEYTEPAIPITAGGHFPCCSDEEHLVLLRSGDKLFELGGVYQTPRDLDHAIEIYRHQLQILESKRSERAAAIDSNPRRC